MLPRVSTRADTFTRPSNRLGGEALLQSASNGDSRSARYPVEKPDDEQLRERVRPRHGEQCHAPSARAESEDDSPPTDAGCSTRSESANRCADCSRSEHSPERQLGERLRT